MFGKPKIYHENKKVDIGSFIWQNINMGEEKESLIEELTKIQADSDETRKISLDFLKKHGGSIAAEPHNSRNILFKKRDTTDLDQPHGVLREWIRAILHGRLGI